MKFFQIKRMNGVAEAVCVDDNGKVEKRVFTAKMTDAQIKAEITGEKIQEHSAVSVKKEDKPASFPAAPATTDKAALRSHYVAFLKSKGVDMTTERSFRKIEEAYQENGGK